VTGRVPESNKPPPSSHPLTATTCTVESMSSPPPSRFRLALALRIVATVPSHLTLSEYLLLLRSHVTQGPRPSPAVYIDAIAFWRTRCETISAQLTAATAELAETAALLDTERKRPAPAGVAEAGREAEAGAVVETKRRRRLTPAEKALEEWEAVSKDLLLPGKGCLVDTRGVLAGLRAAYFTPNTAEATSALRRALAEFVLRLSSVPLPTAAKRKPGKRSPKFLAAAAERDRVEAEAEVRKLCALLAVGLSRVVTCLYSLPAAEKSRGLEAAVRLLVGVLACVKDNTRALLLTPPAGGGVRDMRLGVTKCVLHCLSSLDFAQEAAGALLEGFYREFAVVLRDCLRVVAGGKKDWMEGVVVEESGWFYLLILEATWGMFKKHCDGKFAMGGVRELLAAGELKGGWKDGAAVLSMEGGAESFTRSAFAAGVLSVVGLDVFEI
jgi:hypothetical protein